jgi:hypothetical protein
VVTLAAAAALVVWEPWHGPIVLSLSSGHGVTAGNLLAVPLVVLAICIGRVRSRSPRPAGRTTCKGSSGRLVGPTSAVVLSVLLLLVGIVDLVDRGPLVPAGGGTFDGTVQSVASLSASPVRVHSWSHVALTYDGASLRLFVNGVQVSSQATTGTIQSTTEPLWIGGNHPYGEYFEGVIDEARVYNRALGEDEIQGDMATPVTGSSPSGDRAYGATSSMVPTSAAGLVAAYSFDAGTGMSAADGSGNGNVGTITGATWTTRGRYGNALSFDGADDTVRVPASASLDIRSALTLSAWIRPTAPQSGWRTIEFRETDTYFLTASSDLAGLVGRADDVLAGSVAAAAAWFSVVMVSSRGRWVGPRRRSWYIAVGMLLLGFIVDSAFAPHATVFGPTLLAVWFAATARSRAEAASGWFVAIGLTGATVVSLADLAGMGIQMQKDDGAIARSVALGITLLVIGLVTLRYNTRPRVE